MLDGFLLTGLKKTHYAAYVAWRAFLHAASSLILLVAIRTAELRSGLDLLPYAFAALVAAITFVEFYLHPKLYRQRLLKGVIDWLSWVLPFAVYFFLGGA